MTESSAAYRAYREWVTEPPNVEPEVSVVIPAYNEEWRILPTIGAIATHMSSRHVPWELIICDDGSTDATVDLVHGLQFANLRLLIADKNTGKGDAVRRGMLAARGNVVLFADADQSTPIEQFDRLNDRISEGFDVVVGSRAADGAEVSGKSLSRKILSGGLRLIVSRGFGVTVSDTQCGFKLFTRDAAQELFAAQLIDGFSFDLEVLYLAHKFGRRVAEEPVEWIDAPGSTVDTARVSLQFVRDLVRIRSYDVQGRYRRPRHNPVSPSIHAHRPFSAKEPVT
jgi:dolichyl-phosphate beta-glucosyltransferase